ncbi:glycerol kinase-like [Penaeus monodon]|uniref:glycerol kinase-like n=1 Tax=Penaeus monodon TaxID=6687 RepID=UPI0018A7D5EB|nr:glycerol kinase-like [Penaeus monodon]
MCSKCLPLRVDGGVAQNDFLLQMIATLTGKTLERPKSIDVSALGCAFLAGMGAGIWKSREELIPLHQVGRTFEPQLDQQPKLLRQMKEWERALQRFTKWHKNSSSENGVRDEGRKVAVDSGEACPCYKGHRGRHFSSECNASILQQGKSQEDGFFFLRGGGKNRCSIFVCGALFILFLSLVLYG